MTVTNGKARSSTALRREMVAALERDGVIHSRSIRRAFQSIPRELFVPEIAARDGLPSVHRPERALATALDGRGMSISSSSAPIIMGLMLEALQLSPGLRVLEIGAGTGYNAALLKYVVGEEGVVTSVDIESAFARRARRALAQAGSNCRIVIGDGRDGWPRGAPYDRIMVTAASDTVTQAWRDQLVDGGLLELPLRVTRAFLPQLIVTFRRDGLQFRSEAVFSGMFMALREQDGANSPIDHDPALRAVAGTAGSLTVLASLQGQVLSRLSASARQRALAVLLGKSRRMRTLASEPGLGLITFLQLSGIANLVGCSVGDRYGVAIIGPRGSNVVSVTRAPGQSAWIEVWGDGPVDHLYVEHVQQWERLGAPTLGDLRLTIGRGRSVTKRAWRTLRLADSVVSVDWAS
jgi:protein-L-isoaspartate(D-aspartate) O-methyltransferase